MSLCLCMTGNMNDPIDTMEYPYSVCVMDPLPVMAHVWLKNNDIAHRSHYAVNAQGEPDALLRCIYFADANHAAWFALKWC